MKMIVSCENANIFRRFYFVNFIYDNINEENKLIKILNDRNIIYEKSGINNIYIEQLEFLINLLLKEFNLKIIINDDCYDFYNNSNINNSIDKTSCSNGILKKGNYFNKSNTYYILFNYNNDTDMEPILYYFNSEFNNMIYNLNMHPYIISKKKNKFSGKSFVRATDIPKDLLPFFIKKFIEEYHMTIYIDNYELKDKFDNDQLLEGLSKLENNNTKIKKRIN